MANSKYIGYPIVADARDLMQRSFDYMAAKISGWLPSEGQVDTAVLEATGNEAADIATLTTEVPKSIFRYFGSKLFGIPPIDATSATCTSTWFLTDTAGHTISAGTQVAIVDADGQLQPFVVLLDVIVPGGQSQTTAGEVVLLALNPGADSSGIGSIGGVVQLIDQLAWVDHITQIAVTTGGQDAELDDEYIDRLAVELQTMSPRPILPNDFAILARNVAGIQRSAAIDGYNPDDATFNNERMICLANLDANGVWVGSTIDTNAKNYLDGLREINFVIKTVAPSSQQVDVTVHYNAAAGYSITDTNTRVTSVITNFLDPTQWGISATDDPNDPRTWNNNTRVRFLELATLINEVPGVAYINLLLLGPHGGTLVAADLDLTGVVPLPAVGTLSVVGS